MKLWKVMYLYKLFHFKTFREMILVSMAKVTKMRFL